MEFLAVGVETAQVERIAMPLVPGRIADFSQDMAEYAVPLDEIQVERTEIAAEITQLAEQPDLTDDFLSIDFELARKLVYHDILQSAFRPIEIVLAPESRPMPGVGAKLPVTLEQ